jgi:glycosyltransferase involved in cell wall biosynthesis
MKILIDAHVFDDKFQGSRSYLQGLYCALIPIAENWEFYFVAHDIDNLRKVFGTAENVHCIQYSSHNKYYRLLIDLPRLVNENKIDIAHYTYISPLIKNCKTIVTLHDILFKEDQFKKYFPFKYRVVNDFLFKRSAKKSDVLVTISEYSRGKISDYYQINKKDIFITPIAVSTDFTPDNVESIKEKYKLNKYILFVSRIEPRKNHVALLQAYHELELWKENYQLVFIGVEDIVTDELNNYKKTHKEQLKDNVIWLEGISYNELKGFYKDCDLFVFPSFGEGFGIPPLEAIVMDRKVLCSTATALSDFDFPENMSFDPFNVNELKVKMTNLLANNSSEIEEVKTKLLSKYNWENIADDFYELISLKMKAPKND